MPNAPFEQVFTRNRFTWLAYLLFAYYSYLLNGLGPLLPYLRADLHLNYAETSLHSSTFALGMLGAGILGDSVAQRFGRARTLWGAALGMALGATLLLISHTFWMSLLGVMIMGMLGSLLLMMIPATLSDHYGEQRNVH